MKPYLFLCLLALLAVPVGADDFFPGLDIMHENHWGELITIFSPHTFYFDGEGFNSPVRYQNGTAKIGSRV